MMHEQMLLKRISTFGIKKTEKVPYATLHHHESIAKPDMDAAHATNVHRQAELRHVAPVQMRPTRRLREVCAQLLGFLLPNE